VAFNPAQCGSVGILCIPIPGIESAFKLISSTSSCVSAIGSILEKTSQLGLYGSISSAGLFNSHSALCNLIRLNFSKIEKIREKTP